MNAHLQRTISFALFTRCKRDPILCYVHLFLETDKVLNVSENESKISIATNCPILQLRKIK